MFGELAAQPLRVAFIADRSPVLFPLRAADSPAFDRTRRKEEQEFLFGLRPRWSEIGNKSIVRYRVRDRFTRPGIILVTFNTAFARIKCETSASRKFHFFPACVASQMLRTFHVMPRARQQDYLKIFIYLLFIVRIEYVHEY